MAACVLPRGNCAGYARFSAMTKLENFQPPM
jgi:hypothetical protein